MRYSYVGDINLEHGGTFYNFSDWQHGYVRAVEVTDLDGACGYDGAILIEGITILIDRSREDLAQALACIGASFLPNGDINDNGRLHKKHTSAYRHLLAYACQSWGFKDTDRSEVIQTERDGAMSFEGWHAKKKLRTNASLENYVRKNWLRN